MDQQKDQVRLYRRVFWIYFVCFILSLGQLEVLVLAKGSDYYTAAVFEHVRYDDPSSESTPQEIIRKNLLIYTTATEAAAKEKADIIIFPEWGLYRHDKTNRSTVLPFAEDIPDPAKGHWNFCDDHSISKDHPVLSHLSCLASANGLYLVANVADIKKCTPDDTCETADCSQDNRQCPPDGRKFFNTNVVFDRKGTLVSRYYKSHLYFEPDFNVPSYPKPAYFKTDFGLFTTFICFDMTFREAVEAVEMKNVLNVAYPTFWYDHLPLMSAIQYQQAWAITNRVNLLAADVHIPGTGTIGSGIYSGAKGALVYTFNSDGEAKLLISKVPIDKDLHQDFKPDAKIFRIRAAEVKDITDEEQDSKVPLQCSPKILGPPKDFSKDYRCGELNTTSYGFKKLEDPSGSLEVCQEGSCCSVSYSADSMDEDFYLVVHSGVTWVYDTYGFCVETCMVIRCDKENESEGCNTYPLVSKTRFRSLKLSGNFDTKYVYPSVLKSKMRLAPTREWRFRNGDDEAEITYDPKSENGERILAVGLYGRCYDRDPPFPS